jgi:Zn-dependent protease
MDSVLAPARPRLALHVGLFLATVATTLWAGFQLSPLAAFAPTLPNVVRGGLPFAASLVAILFCHEMGHYLVARRHGVTATLPYFIPVPFGAGTLGAVIRMRSAIPSRRATLDIAAAGPLAGLVVAVPLLLWGLAHSEVRAGPAGSPVASALVSPFAMVRALLEGRPLLDAVPVTQFFGDSLLTAAAARLVHGDLPPGSDVVLHPVAFAAWLGLLVTTLNLVPLGQLDGGHVLYALAGRRLARAGSRLVSLGLLAAGLFLSWNWIVWWALTRFLLGLGHPPALSEEPLDPPRAALAVRCSSSSPPSSRSRSRSDGHRRGRIPALMAAAESEAGDEARAWAEVRAAWQDEAVHRAFLARFADLDGLARAGGRYREALAERPGDPVALRWRDEVLKRATVAGLAALPREAPVVTRVPRWVRPAFLALLAAAIAVLSWSLVRVIASWERP